jgi:hypothetical protein
MTDYDTMVSHPLATRYIAKFMHQAGLPFACPLYVVMIWNLPALITKPPKFPK